MPANPWELRADVRPLELAAQRWIDVATLLARRSDEIVEAARRATDGWDSAAAESYEQHRRQVLSHLDRFAELATDIAGSLLAVGQLLVASQKELDRAWAAVSMIPHDVVGESRQLVFRPAEDDERGKVDRGQVETDEIRGRLTLSLDQESARLRAARAELVTVRSDLTTLAGGVLPGALLAGEDDYGVGTLAPASTSVPGSAQSGVAALSGLPPVAPISVSMPHLSGVGATGLAPLAASAAGGVAGRRGGAAASAAGSGSAGGMGVGATGARGGTSSRGMASGGSGMRRPAAPRPSGANDHEAPRRARERASATQADKDAKRAALADKRAERAARKARRESEKDEPVLEVVESGKVVDEADGTHDAPDAGAGADIRGEGRAGRSS